MQLPLKTGKGPVTLMATEDKFMMKIFLGAWLFLFAVSSFAASSKEVSYKSGDETIKGILFTPDHVKSGEKLPGIVVIHEWWGLNDWVKQQASKLADQGYVALAVDLYRGKTATSPDEAHELMRGLDPDRVTRDLLGASAFLRQQKNVDPAKVGSIGWCMGGGYSLDLALHDPQLVAAVINYGHLVSGPAAIGKIHAAVLGIFGAQDQGIPVADVRNFETALKQAGKKIEIKIYEDAGHAFQNPNNKAGYRPADAADASKRIQDFLAANLKK